MKKLLTIVAAVMISIAAFAQESSVKFEPVKFFGIPVDGTKQEMVRALKAKGFTQVKEYTDDIVLQGEFNGEDVYIHIVTENNKVWRIAVADQKSRSEGQIRIRYNNLVRQFSENPKYKSTIENPNEYLIPDDENISYEITVKDKQYQAGFHQYLSLLKNNRIELESVFAKDLLNSFKSSPEKVDSIKAVSQEQYLLLTDALETGVMPIETAKKLSGLDENKWDEMFDAIDKIRESSAILSNNVWFTILENSSFLSYGEYYICMYYDNELNRSKGEDL